MTDTDQPGEDMDADRRKFEEIKAKMQAQTERNRQFIEDQIERSRREAREEADRRRRQNEENERRLREIQEGN